MATRIYKSNLEPMTKKFNEIINIIESVVNDEESIKKSSVEAARDFAKTLEQKYTAYINRVENSGQETHAGSVYINETEKGATVGIRGKDVLYQEYGTGTKGERKPHPTHNQDGMYPYGSGEYVIHRGRRNNGDLAPRWYTLYRDYGSSIPKMKEKSWLTGKEAERLANDFNDEPIGFNDYVWKHNGIITKGLPTGRFMYDTRKMYEDKDELAGNKILKETIVQIFESKTKEKINKVMTTEESKLAYFKSLSKRDEYMLQEAMRKAAGL